MPFISNVHDLLNFSPWRTKDITEICSFINTCEIKDCLLPEFIHHCLSEEDHGFKNLEKTKTFLSSKRKITSQEEQATVNLLNAYQNLINVEKGENYGLLEESMLRKTNKIIRQEV
jgi:hypothetical protein